MILRKGARAVVRLRYIHNGRWGPVDNRGNALAQRPLPPAQIFGTIQGAYSTGWTWITPMICHEHP